MCGNGGGMRSCRLRENDLSGYTGVDAGDEPANCATPGSFLYHVLAQVFILSFYILFSSNIHLLESF
jgi:hypothetical protein